MPTVKADNVLAAAKDLAHAALLEVTEAGAVGEHLGMVMDADRLGTHFFACSAPGYPGWRWAVTVARPPRARKATVCETHLVPGDGALLAPAWVPYAERLAPGDIGAGDVTPFIEADPNLEAGWEATGEEDVDQLAILDLGLGRPRVLSAEGRDQAAQRWYDSDRGPSADIARQAPASCGSCGYFLPMAGALRAVFGVCANEWSPSDGGVVALTHGCGAHSEIDVKAPEPERIEPPVLDDNRLEIVTS